jgi:hypothetical protein
MPVKRKYTNATFTKRVDHQAGRHRPARGMREPAVCKDCGSIYVNRRWTSGNSALLNELSQPSQPPQMTTCPACQQKATGEPRGFVYLDGEFVDANLKEIQRLLRNESERAEEDNPLARILKWKYGETHNLAVSTTTEHLAQRLGRALEKAFGGNTHYDFSHENKLARVSWKRE